MYGGQVKVLIVGGTRFVGRHVVVAALAAGHEVTLFNRGQSNPEIFPGCTHVRGDRNGDLSALGTGRWDATIDTCGYFVRQVEALANALGERGGQHVFVSSAAVYGVPVAPGFTEDSPLIELADTTTESIDGFTVYGGLKVACERSILRRHGEGSLIVRPPYVVGPYDDSWRFPWWVTRMARGGEVLVPGPPDDPAQLIDARDLAEWIIAMLERSSGGIYHTAGPSPTFTWGSWLETIASTVAPRATDLIWVDEVFLLERGLDGETLPMWAGGDDPTRWLMAADSTRALSQGLTLRPFVETVRDTLAWTTTQVQPTDVGVTPARESELLAEWARRG